MSAPLVVNTTDGMVWMRRKATRDGAALYAMAGTRDDAPALVMATYAELEEHGIAGLADALPMPGAVALPVGVQLERRTTLLREVQATCRRRGMEIQGRKAYEERLKAEIAELRARIAELEARCLPKLCVCGHTPLVHTVPEPRSCFAGKIEGAEPCDCGSYRQLPFAEADRRLAESHARQAADRLTALLAPTQALNDGACEGCGMAPAEWCPDCAKCQCAPVHDAGCPQAGGDPC